MPALFYRFPMEKTARCVLASQNSMTFFNRRRERVRLLLSIFFGYLLEEKATKIYNQSLNILLTKHAQAMKHKRCLVCKPAPIIKIERPQGGWS